MKDSTIFNKGILLSYTENDLELASQMLEMAVMDIPAFFAKANTMYPEQQDQASQFIHKLKGVAAAVGAEQIYLSSQHCEQTLKNETTDRNSITELMDTLSRQIQTFCQNEDVKLMLRIEKCKE